MITRGNVTNGRKRVPPNVSPKKKPLARTNGDASKAKVSQAFRDETPEIEVEYQPLGRGEIDEIRKLEDRLSRVMADEDRQAEKDWGERFGVPISVRSHQLHRGDVSPELQEYLDRNFPDESVGENRPPKK